MITTELSEYIFCVIEKLRLNPYVYVSYDKANSVKKSSCLAMPKVLTFFNPKIRKIEEYLLDVDSLGENSAEVETAIKFTLDKGSLL